MIKLITTMDTPINFTKDFQRSLKAFLFTKLLAYTQSAFAQFLISIYFWRITGNISFLVMFNVIYTLAHVLTFLPAGKIAKEWNRFVPLRIGMLLQLVYLACIILLRENIVSYIIPIAIIGGIAHGAYWISDNILKLDLTNPENRLKFVASYSITQLIANASVPLIASVLVVTDGNIFHAYSRIFVLAIIFAVFVLISSYFISQKKKFKSGKFTVVQAAKTLLKDRNIRIACISNGLGNVSSSLPMLLGILMYVSSGTELSLGSYQFITVIIAFATTYIMGKYMGRKHYKRMLIWGGVLNFALIFILFINQSYGAILLYGILKALFAFLDSPVYPLTTDAFNMFCKTQSECADMRVEYIVLQEFFDAGGTIISAVILLVLHNSLNPILIGITVTLFALGDLMSNVAASLIKGDQYVVIDQLN